VGAVIAISHFRDGYMGVVDDQRQTFIISGGNLLDSVEVLDAFVGAELVESELTEVRSLISDTCQYVALSLSQCVSTCVFSGDTFLGFSGASLKIFNSAVATIPSLYTQRVPLAEQWLASLDDNVFIDATSEFNVAASGWRGELQNGAAAGARLTAPGAHLFIGRNVADIASGLTVYLGPAGHSASVADQQQRGPRRGTLKRIRVDVDNAPGAGQTFTYAIFVAGVQAGTLLISGASQFAASGFLNYPVVEGAAVDIRLITSAGANTDARHYFVAQMV
jgi:hypothetical protein